MIDNIFGNLLEPRERLEYHRWMTTGVKHLYRRSPLDPRPNESITLELTTGSPGVFDSARCFYTIEGSAPTPGRAALLPMDSAESTWDTITWGYVRKWTVRIPPQPAGTLIRYKLEAHQVESDQWIPADASPQEPAPIFALWVDHDPPPDWASQARVYQIFPDRFYPGDDHTWNETRSLTDFYGGTLRGVIDKLEYIQTLGFNTLWLNPFFTTNSHHGYNASDYYTVEPRLGTNADLQELIEKAHERGMRLLLDFVANHWSKEHFTFREASSDPKSRYHDWYFWNHWPDDYECYFKVRELPKINLDHPEARKYMLDVARHWLRQGFDGYRLDFAYGPSHAFWVDFRRACREIKPECWIFGEIIHTVPMLLSYTGIMDGTLDFHLARALRETFAQENMKLSEFEAFLSGHEACFPPDHIRPSFLDNHDEARFLHLAGDDKNKLRLAALVMFTLSAPPIVYCGTETGLSQERPMYHNGRNIFEETRLPVNWETADTTLQDYFRKLNLLRQEFPVLLVGFRHVLKIEDESGLYAYTREDDKTKVLIVINISKQPRSCRIRIPGNHLTHDALSNSPVYRIGDELEIQLAPQSGAVVTE